MEDNPPTAPERFNPTPLPHIPTKGQHHPGMTVAEVALQNSLDFNNSPSRSPSSVINARQMADLDDKNENVLKLLGKMLKNISNTTPYFMWVVLLYLLIKEHQIIYFSFIRYLSTYNKELKWSKTDRQFHEETSAKYIFTFMQVMFFVSLK